ncbi:MAG: hypothetical protein DMG96_20030 [Acidobacteria bacterium]|nr:MAG: hypothetical protein DMG98_18855 [Acidobacteriota bacterium]PYV74507.1 MAG: hypothetical protein DMG96_20030 [Acidobacteriota bacterium]
MTKSKLSVRLENTQEVQLLCTCCGQPYYPTKAWQDKLQAIFVGAEKYAIGPVCTQKPSDDVFSDQNYRRRCRYHVERLQVLYELNRKKQGFGKPKRAKG